MSQQYDEELQGATSTDATEQSLVDSPDQSGADDVAADTAEDSPEDNPEASPEASPEDSAEGSADPGTEDVADVAGSEEDVVAEEAAADSETVPAADQDASVEDTADADVAGADAVDDAEDLDPPAADPLEEFREALRSKVGDWFVVHTYSGMENRVKANLENRITSLNMEDYIHEIVVPTEDVAEIKNGQRKLRTKPALPGVAVPAATASASARATTAGASMFSTSVMLSGTGWWL